MDLVRHWEAVQRGTRRVCSLFSHSRLANKANWRVQGVGRKGQLSCTTCTCPSHNIKLPEAHQTHLQGSFAGQIHDD